ncbi:MAG: serine/threonine protein kinase [Deltaproteobacteria bacterium]|nr:serine/threonine protein kinase [Deltaproteobacteria bacterium]
MSEGSMAGERERRASRAREASTSSSSIESSETEARAERQELHRARSGMTMMIVAWLGTLPADFTYAWLLGVDATVPILVTRGIGFVLVLAMWARFRGATEMTARELSLHRYLLVGTGMGALAIESTFLGGFHSHIATGAILIGAALGVFPQRWRDHLPLATFTALLYPTIVLAITLAGGPSHEQLSDPLAVFELALHVTMIVLSTAIAVVISHLAWSLRRGSFENKRVGQYRLRKRLGRGGMGEVWAAHHKGLRRDVAVKMLDGGHADPIARERFEREVRATCELRHPHTVRVFDYGATDDGVLYYAMELLEGEHLGAVVRREGALPPERAVYLIEQAARALGEAHDKGIVHRDVKSENLFVSDSGGEPDFVKVLDFGIARDVGEEGTALTRPGAIAGTASTVSPEVVAGKSAGPQADVYGLGAVLYFCLTGRHPFEREHREATLRAHLTESVVPPSELATRPIPADVEAIVMRCLEKEPEDRFADGRALASALSACSVAGRHRPSLAPKRPAAAPADEQVTEELVAPRSPRANENEQRIDA